MCIELETAGRPTFLSLDVDAIAFVNKFSNGYLVNQDIHPSRF